MLCVVNNSNICKICGKQFKKPALLLRHQVVHTQEKTFACTSCSRCFSQQSSLQRHIRIKHLVILPSTTENADDQCDTDADHVVAQHVLAALAHLHSGMEQVLAPVSKPQATQEEQPSCQLVQLRHKLHPAGHIQTVATQMIQRQSNSSYYVCEYCAKEFSKSYDLIRHRRTHTRDKPFKCNHCIKRFATQAKLGEHRRRLHATIHKHPCNHCSASFHSSRKLNLHLAKQHGDLIYECSKCKCVFYTKTAFDAHKKLEQDQELRVLSQLLPNPSEQLNIAQRCYRCVYCAKIFSRKYNCRKHMITHVRRLLDEEPHQADPKETSAFCLVKTTHSLDSFDYETRLLPSKSCVHCNRVFQKPSDLARHFRIHSGLKPHVCNVCHKSFALNSSLSRHMQTHQTQRATVNCQVCGKCYASKTSLQLHLRLHTGVRPFKCEVCHQTFRTSGHKIEHMRADRHKSDIKWTD